jgi:hypothetical protein
MRGFVNDAGVMAAASFTQRRIVRPFGGQPFGGRMPVAGCREFGGLAVLRRW